MNKKNIIVFSGAFLFLAVLIFVSVSVKKEPEPAAEKEQAMEPKKISGEYMHLASGKQAFEIITGGSQRFRILEAEVDPLDVKFKETQKISVLVKDFDDEPITYKNRVEGTVFTDNKTLPLSFELREVKDDSGGTLTLWEGFWILDDTYDRIYMINIKARSDNREHEINLTFR